MIDHPIAIKILKYLKNKRECKIDDLVKDLNLNKDAVVRFLYFLEKDGYVKLDYKKKKEYIKTNRAKELHEEKLLNLGKKEIDLKDLDKDLIIGIGILKKKGILKIEKGKAIIDLDKLKKHLEKLKENLDNPKDEEIIKELKKRGLLEVKEKLVIEGVRLIKDIDIDEEEKIGLLTIEILKNKEYKKKKLQKYNIYSNVDRVLYGKTHPYEDFLTRIKEKLIGLGFKEMNIYKNSIVISEFINFDALNVPSYHISRFEGDTFFIDGKKEIEDKEYYEKVKEEHLKRWKYFDEEKSKNLILKTHNTALSILQLLNNIEIPGKYFAIDRVFRYDTIDWKHFIEFNQLEGIVIDYNLNFKHLVGMIKVLVEKIVGIPSNKIYLKPGFFPFTEPSLEIMVKEGNNYIEIGGAGIFRKEVIEPIFGKYIPTLAWGLGIDRMFLVKYKINDIRKLYSNDIEELRNQRYYI